MRDTIIRFLASSRGRWARIGLGGVLLAGGVARRNVALCAVGAAVAGIAIADIYPPAVLFGASMRGNRLRRQLGMAADAPLLRS